MDRLSPPMCAVMRDLMWKDRKTPRLGYPPRVSHNEFKVCVVRLEKTVLQMGYMERGAGSSGDGVAYGGGRTRALLVLLYVLLKVLGPVVGKGVILGTSLGGLPGSGHDLLDILRRRVLMDKEICGWSGVLWHLR